MVDTPSVRVVSLDCPGCGASLEVRPALSQLACGYCGKVAMVERGGGTIALVPMIAAIERVQVGTDKTAAELAMARLRGEIADTKRLRDYSPWAKHPETLKNMGSMIASFLSERESYRAKIKSLEAEYEQHRAIVEGRSPPESTASTVTSVPIGV